MHKNWCFDRKINGNRDVEFLERDYLLVQRCVKLTLVAKVLLSNLYTVAKGLTKKTNCSRGLKLISRKGISDVYQVRIVNNFDLISCSSEFFPLLSILLMLIIFLFHLLRIRNLKKNQEIKFVHSEWDQCPFWGHCH